MRRLTCRKVEELLFDYLDGALEEQERAAVAVHVAICDACRASAELCAGLAVAVKEAPLPEARASGRGEIRPGLGPALRAALAVAAAAAIIGAGAGVWFAQGRAAHGRRSMAEGAQAVAAPPARNAAVREILDGGGRRAFELGIGTALRLDEGAVAEVAGSGADEVRFVLGAGSAIAEVGAMEPGFRFVVETGDAAIEARGTVFEIDASGPGGTSVRVASGCVEVRRAGRGDPILLYAGEELSAGEAAPRVASIDALTRDLAAALELDVAAAPADAKGTTSAGASGDLPAASRAEVVAATEALVGAIARAKGRSSRGAGADAERLLELAQAYRRAALFEDAVRAYERLIAAHPDTGIGQSALVALAQLEWHVLGRADDARAHYESYLARAPRGPLADVARRDLAKVGAVRLYP
jgi:tetratricopeptide (TPR) repeat protein